MLLLARYSCSGPGHGDTQALYRLLADDITAAIGERITDSGAIFGGDNNVALGTPELNEVFQAIADVAKH